MKILFVENRGKTYIYEQAAKELEKQGHKISWLIYNHAIKVDCGSVNVIPYPKRKDMDSNSGVLSEEASKIIERLDRYTIYYGRGTDHYPYYFKWISDILDKEKPDVVFGEMSTFYCVMCSLLCEKNKIPMYTEGVARYPRNRFTFNIPNKYRQVSSSGDLISFAEAKKEWQKISNRQSKPEYMDRFDFDFVKKFKTGIRRDVQRLRYLFEYFKGEKFFTRNLQDTIKDYLIKRKNKKKWNAIAKNTISQDDKFIILFPLQMQPEFNLDVWGGEFRNQTEVIEKIANIIPDGAVLYVKSNPAFNLEVSESLINVTNKASNIFALNTEVSMDNIFEDIDMVITVTGTISIECVFSNKPVISLAETPASNFTGCVCPNNIDEVAKLVLMAMQNEFPLADDDEKYKFYSHLVDSSHAGAAGDYTRSVEGKIPEGNLEKIVISYSKLLEQLESGILEFKGKENFTNDQSQHS